MSQDLWVVGLGRMEYDRAHTLKRQLARARIDGTLTNDLLL